MNKPVISSEPIEETEMLVGALIYIPKADDFPDRIYQVVGSASNQWRLANIHGHTIKVDKTNYAVSWFTQAYYDWVLSIYKQYDYVLGWCILTHRCPEYKAFLRQVMKMEHTESWMIIKNK